MPQSEFFRPKHAPRAVGVSRSTIYRWITRGILTPRKSGSMTFIKTQEAIDYINGLGDQLGDQKPQS